MQCKRATVEEKQDGDIVAQLRALAFACLDFEAAASDALLDAWFAADAAQQRAWGSALTARHLNFAGSSVATDVAWISAKQGNLRCLRWAHERHGRRWDEYICMYAAMSGHLACLAYAHERGCMWDAHTCAYAAMYGHLACLRYAHENGCKWDAITRRYAAISGQLACLR